MKPFFKELFAYNHHYNQQLGELIVAQGDKISEKSFSLYNHIINAHQIWNGRIMLNEPLFEVWALHPVEKLLIIDANNHSRSLELLDTISLNHHVSYQNSKGQKFENMVKDIFFHIINHSTYHRGQLAILFRESNLAPVITDYIFYKR